MHALLEVQEGRPDANAGGGGGGGGQPAGKRGKLSAFRLTMKNDSNSADQATALPKRQLSFKKKMSGSFMKVTYADNLRTYGNGRWCRWTIKIDGRDCSVPIFNTKYTSSTQDNDLFPHAIEGTCKGIRAGGHTMTIALTRSSGADCYTGWSPSSGRDAFFMEAVELNPSGQIATAMRLIS